MSDHYNYLSHLTSDGDIQKLITAAAVGVGLVLLGRKASRKLSSPDGIAGAVIPETSVTLPGFFDFFIEAFVKFQDSILGKENRKYLPFTGSIFLFILVSNLIGLIPGVPALTTTVWINVGMALVVFIYFNYLGIKSNGLVGYLKHFCGPFTRGPMLLIGLFLFVLEVFFTLPLRVLTLNMRLYWNISADHTALEAFTGLVPYLLPVVFYVLGTFVCFMQAFIFTTLTMVYILLATQHEEEGHDH